MLGLEVSIVRHGGMSYKSICSKVKCFIFDMCKLAMTEVSSVGKGEAKTKLAESVRKKIDCFHCEFCPVELTYII